MGLASINIKFQVDLREFSTEMQNSLRTIDKFGQKMQSVGRGLTAAITLPILAVGAASLKMASDYNESLNKVDVSFKGSSAQVKEFAKTSLESFGIAAGTSLDLASAYGDMGTSMGLTTDEAAKMSTSLVGLAGDLASFKNISIDIANTAISAIFTGETESLKKLGIVMTEVNLKRFALTTGIKQNYEQLSQAEKVQLRYNYILSVTQNAQGDFARTSGGAANQTRIFTESLKQVGQEIGAVILPLFTRIITSINEQIKAFSSLSEGTKTTIVVIAGLAAVVGPLLFTIGAVAALIPTVVAGFTILSGAVTAVSGAFTVLSAAMIANPITALVLVVTAAAAAYFLMNKEVSNAVKSSNELNSSQKLMQKVTDEATSSIVDQKAQLESLLQTARNENETKSNRLKAIQAINAISPKYLGNLTLENINTDKARISLEKYNTALIAGATARAASRLLEQNQADKIKAGFDREKALAEYNEKRNNAIAQGFEAEKKFYEDNNRQLQFANEALERKNKKYDAEAKLLTDIYDKNKKNLDLLTTGSTGTTAVAPVNGDKVKLDKVFQDGTIAFYEKQITKLKQQQNEVAKTEAAYFGLGNAINVIQNKINSISVDGIEPINLTSLSIDEQIPAITGGFDKLISEMQSKVGGFTAVSESMKSVIFDLSETISNAVTQLAVNATVGFGEALGGVIAGTQSLGTLFSGMLGLVANFMKDLGKQLIAIGIARIAFDKLKFSGVGAVAAGIALVALSTVISSKFEKAPKFETGGIVGGASFYGDKILARVNSGEMIANNEQQKRIFNSMNSGGGSTTIIPDVVLKGNDLYLSFTRTLERNNRTR